MSEPCRVEYVGGPLDGTLEVLTEEPGRAHVVPGWDGAAMSAVWHIYTPRRDARGRMLGRGGCLALDYYGKETRP